jgi:hypothetical protein
MVARRVYEAANIEASASVEATTITAAHVVAHREAMSYARTMRRQATRERMRRANETIRLWQPRGGDEGKGSFGGKAGGW